ncbi:MAG: hypothetical protein H0T89_01085 [Deltaproteobacteria bacterium]|nr:hypothetical protein [Deltaproteobacteria bacterium]
MTLATFLFSTGACAVAAKPTQSSSPRPVTPAAMAGDWFVTGYRSPEPILGKSQEGPAAILGSRLVLRAGGSGRAAPKDGMTLELRAVDGGFEAAGSRGKVESVAIGADGSLTVVLDGGALRLVRDTSLVSTMSVMCASDDGRSFTLEDRCHADQVYIGERRLPLAAGRCAALVSHIGSREGRPTFGPQLLALSADGPAYFSSIYTSFQPAGAEILARTPYDSVVLAVVGDRLVLYRQICPACRNSAPGTVWVARPTTMTDCELRDLQHRLGLDDAILLRTVDAFRARQAAISLRAAS